MQTFAVLTATALFILACSADNATTTSNATETTAQPQESDDETQKRSAIERNENYQADPSEDSQQRQYPYPGNTGYGSYEGNYQNPNYGNDGYDHGYDKVIPGKAVQDYPIYAHPPITRFSCKGLPAGLYGDQESRCQAWHSCQDDGRHDQFLCPNGTLFNQKFLVCDWWYNVECGRSDQYIVGSLYPPNKPQPTYPPIYPPYIHKQPHYPFDHKPTQKPYGPTAQKPYPIQRPQLPQQPYPPTGPQLPYYPAPIPAVSQQPYPPQIPQKPYFPQGPRPLYPQEPRPLYPQGPSPLYPQEPRPLYPQGPHITFPGPYLHPGNKGDFYQVDIGSGAINRNFATINPNNNPSAFPLYKAAATSSTKTKATVDFPTDRKADDNQEDFEPEPY